MGRKPIELTEAQKGEVETLAAVLSAQQIADYFGIARTTFFEMVKRDSEIAERYRRGKAKAIGAIAKSLINKARGGDTTSMIFYLKTQAGWRETATVEVVEQDREAVPLDLSKLSDGALQELANLMPENRPRAALQGSGGRRSDR